MKKNWNYETKVEEIETIISRIEAGELQLEAFYVSQLYATRFWLALIVKNLLKSTIDDIEASTKYVDAITKGWLIAKQAKPLFGIKWDELWEHSLEEVRADLNIVFPDI